MMRSIVFKKYGVICSWSFARRYSAVTQAVMLVAFAFTATSLLHGQKDALQIDNKGNVGIGTTTPQANLDVSGNERVLSGSNPLLIAPAWDNFADPSVTENNRAEIANDTGKYKTLMLVGNKSGDGKTRVVSVWDRLVVNGSLGIGTETPADYDLLTGQFSLDIGLGKRNGGWARAFRIVNSINSDGRDGGAFGVSGEGKTPNYAYIAIPTKDPIGWDSEKILVLNNAGNVGIGTNDPHAKLDVAGTVRASGGFVPAYDSGWIGDDHQKDHPKIFEHNLKRLPALVMLFFSPDGGTTEFPVNLERTQTHGNPVSTEVTSTHVTLFIWSGDPLHQTWRHDKGWTSYDTGYWRVVVF